MADVIINGVTYNDVPQIRVPTTDGGVARFTDISETTAAAGDVANGKVFYAADGSEALGTFTWDFKGYKPELIDSNIYSFSSKLKDTDFATWTPATSASTIVASKTAGTFSADLANYEYLLHWKATFDGVYPAGTTLKAAPVREIGDLWQSIIKRPNSVDNIVADNFNSNACITLNSTPLHVYYNTSGNLVYTYSITYGIYPTVVAATFSNSTSNTSTVTVKTPSISARCNSSYFSTGMADVIDQDKSIVKIQGELWRVPVGATTRSLYEALIDLYNNPLT